MRSNKIVPIAQLNRRAPEAGRIRMGEKKATAKGKARPAAIKEFRFTSAAKELIEQVASIFGGTCQPWPERGQWQVYSEVSEIPVVLIPDGLSTYYELWSGGGCLRRCDGIACEVTRRVSDDDYEKIEVDCLCTAEGQRQCQPYTRLNVLIPDLAFAGTWRIESHGWNAAQELPGMYDMIVGLAEGEFIQAVLGFAQRETPTVVGTRKYVVPYLRIRQTLPELLAGKAGMAALNASPSGIAMPALPSGASSAAELPDRLSLDVDDDGIIEGEIIEDDPEMEALEEKLTADAKNFGIDPVMYVLAVKRQVDNDKERIAACIAQVRAGQLLPMSVVNGVVQWGKPR